MSLLEKTQATRYDEGHSSAGKLNLKFHGVVVGPVEDRYVVVLSSAVHKLLDLGQDEIRLLVTVHRRNDHRQALVRPGGLENFGVTVLLVPMIKYAVGQF